MLLTYMRCLSVWCLSVDRPLRPTQGRSGLQEAFILAAVSENALLWPLQLLKTGQKHNPFSHNAPVNVGVLPKTLWCVIFDTCVIDSPSLL